MCWQGIVRFCDVLSGYGAVEFCNVLYGYSTVMLCGAVIRVKRAYYSYGEAVYCCMMQSTTKNSKGTV